MCYIAYMLGLILNRCYNNHMLTLPLIPNPLQLSFTITLYNYPLQLTLQYPLAILFCVVVKIKVYPDEERAIQYKGRNNI